ncbi:MAG: choice-of-anchor tandem repeat GloVer-containing protein [Candidatus Cybelea sp.]
MRVAFGRCALGICAAVAMLPGCFGAPGAMPQTSAMAAHADRGKSLTKTPTILYSFLGAPDGLSPRGGLTIDKAGDIFGTTESGGRSNAGTLFELARSKGRFTERIVHRFKGVDGMVPVAQPFEDANGNLFATASLGGNVDGDGAAIELRAKGRSYRETSLLFSGTDGEAPQASFVEVGTKLYTTTSSGGKYGYGAIVALTVPGLAETDVYDFAGPPNDGETPRSSLVADSSGALYGTTEVGGSSYSGTVFKFVPSPSGGSESVLWSFSFADGAIPFAGVTRDEAGNLYTTTESGGSSDYGAVVKLTPSGSGFTEKVLHSFTSSGDGESPEGGLTYKGRFLYGTTPLGGSHGLGTIYRLSTSGGDYSLLYSFQGGTRDGEYPFDTLAVSGQTLYGTTSAGGSKNSGVVFGFLP